MPRNSLPVVTIAKLLTIVAVLLSTGRTCEAVTYRLDVDNTWSTETHPGCFPMKHTSRGWAAGYTTIKFVFGMKVSWPARESGKWPKLA